MESKELQNWNFGPTSNDDDVTTDEEKTSDLALEVSSLARELA